MGEPVGAIAAILGTVHQLAAPLCRQFMYLYNYKANIDNLEEEVGKLKNARDRVERKVVDARDNMRMIDKSIEDWQNKVKNIIQDADELIIKKGNNVQKNVTRDEVKHEDVNLDQAEKLTEEKETNSCFMRIRPNLITRYAHSKEALGKVKTIGELLVEERQFPEVSYDTAPQQIWLISDSGYNTFKSRESTLKDVLNALHGANCHMIGVYGMGGLGKTTLVKEVGREAMKGKSFDKVVLVEVTATPDIEKIQRGIAEQLRLTLPDGSESQRANKLYEALKNNKKSDKENDNKSDEENKKTLGRSPTANKLGLKNDAENDKKKDEKDEKTNKESDEKNKKILIILDNIWEELKLEKIGIPSGADFGESKLLLTTRDKNVLERMGCEPFQIGKLDEKEAWALFKETAGDFVEQDDLKHLPQDVCKKCGGLPIAIVAVAKALSNRRDPSEWREALEQFKRPTPENFEDDLELAYLSIELSYKSLRGKELKKTFLLCSLMGHEGSILELLKYVMGLNIFEEIYTIQKARDRVCKFIRKLKDSGLLLDSHNSESFSMHDFVREVAISIANRDNRLFCVRNDTDLWEWPHKDRLKICTQIFIRDSAIIELPVGLKCPQLQSFFMNTNVSDSRYEISSMPASRLKNSNLRDSQVEIPQKFFEGMIKLKVLDLTRMQLFSLRSSLHLLKDLQTLCLNSCKFEDVAIIGELKCLKILSLRGSNVEQLPEEIAQLTKLRLLDLSYCEQLKVIAPNVISSLFRLEELYMSKCFVEWEIEVHNVERSNASLEELKHLSQLTTLELDIEDDKMLPQGLFSKELKRYKISIGDGSSAFGGSYISSDRRQSMVNKSFNFEEHRRQSMVIKSFNFEELSTFRTLKLKHNSTIFLKESKGFNNVEFLCLDKLEGVENVLYELNKEGFSQLKHLRVHNNHKLLCIVDTRIPHNAFPAFPHMESLIIFNLSHLKTICFGQPKKTSFQSLKSIQVQTCSELKHLFSFSNIAESLPQLQRIYVKDCSNMKEIIAIESEDNISNHSAINLCQLRFLTLGFLSGLESFYSEVETHSTSQSREMESMPLFNEKVVFPNLEVLKLKDVNIEKIWDNQLSTSMSSSYQTLTRLIIRDCENLKYVFPFSMVENFKQLQHLEIVNCKVLKEIVVKGDGADQTTVNFEFPKVTYLRLQDLPELTAFYLGTHTSKWPMLKELDVWDCEKLQIFTSEYKVVSPNLETLKLDGIYSDQSCSYTQIFFCGEEEKHSVTPRQLKYLELNYLSGLKYMWKHDSKLGSALQNLQVLKVSACFNLINLAPTSASFQNLTALTVSGCHGLINLITSSTAKSLVQLREMEIKECEMVIEIVANERDAANNEIVFSKLKSLSLEDLESLTCFCSGNCTFNFPSLEELIVAKCPNLKTFARGDLNTPILLKVKKDHWDEGCWEGELNRTIQQLQRKVVSTNAEEWTLSGNDITSVWEGQFPENFCELKVLKIIKDESANIPIGILQRLNNLEKLILKVGSYEEIFSCEKDEKYAGMLTQIKHVELYHLFGLKYMWKQNSQLDSIIQNLEVLKVNYCHNLITLVPSSAYFENLTTLEICCCDGLINLVSSSTAKSMVRIEEMTVAMCEMMTEVVANEGEVAEDEIVFSKLTSLTLGCLENLTCFYPGNYSFKFPSLDKLIVYKCPKMKIFSGGELSAPNLEKVKWTREDYEDCWEGDLNTTIQHLHKKVNIQSS